MEVNHKNILFPALSIVLFPVGIICFYYFLDFSKKFMFVSLLLSVSLFLVFLNNNIFIHVLIHINLLVFMFLLGTQRKSFKSVNFIGMLEIIFMKGATLLVFIYYLSVISYHTFSKEYPVQLFFGKLPVLYLNELSSRFAILVLFLWLFFAIINTRGFWGHNT